VGRLLPVLLLVALCLPVRVLEVAVEGSPPAGRMWLRSDVSVVVGYVHSVERTWVEETYVAGRDGLHLTMMRWQSFSAGLPDEYDSCVDGFYVKGLDVHMGRTIDYWFLPLNQAEVSVGGVPVFRGPEQPSRLVVRLRRLPVVVRVVDWLGAQFATRSG